MVPDATHQHAWKTLGRTVVLGPKRMRVRRCRCGEYQTRVKTVRTARVSVPAGEPEVSDG